MCGPQFKSLETETDEKKLSAAENQQAFLHPMRIQEDAQYILNNSAEDPPYFPRFQRL